MAPDRDRAHIRGGFGNNAHVLPDIHKALSGYDHPVAEIGISFEADDHDALSFIGNNDLVVWLGRRKGSNEKRPYYDVWQISHVTAQTEEDIDKFVADLEDLEKERAKQIVESWQKAGWSIDQLRTFNDRLIMVIDTVIDSDLMDGTTIKQVLLLSAFNENSDVISWEASQSHQAYMPDSECKERLAEKLGPYEFASIEGARLAWFMWRELNQDPGAVDCMVAGLLAMGHIYQLSDGEWGGASPFSFLSGAAEGEDIDGV